MKAYLFICFSLLFISTFSHTISYCQETLNSCLNDCVRYGLTSSGSSYIDYCFRGCNSRDDNCRKTAEDA